MKFDKHGIAKELKPKPVAGLLPPRRGTVFLDELTMGHLHHFNSVNRPQFLSHDENRSITILGTRGNGKTMLSRNIIRQLRFSELNRNF